VPLLNPISHKYTRAIAKKCGEILNINVPTRDDAPVGVDPEIITLEIDYDVKKRVENLVDKWVKKGMLKASQVAILSPVRRARSSIANTNSINGVKLTENLDQWRDNSAILFSTVKGFKGLEADAIILIDVPTRDDAPHFHPADYYVACSRAKHILVVIRIED